MPTLPEPVPFWRARTARPTTTPRGGSGGGKWPRVIGYMGWRPGETYDLSDVKHSERTINRPMTAGDHIPPVEERAAIRAVSSKPTGYHGHIPRRFDRDLTQPGGQEDVGQIYIHHRPGRVGHPDMPPITLEPQLLSPEHRTIEREPSTVVHRARTEVRHLFEDTKRGSPRGTRDGVGMGYSGHVPQLFGGLKTLPGAPPSLLNGPGLCEKPRVNVRPHCILGAEHSSYALALLTCLRRVCAQFEKSMRLGSHSARAARNEWQRIPPNKIAHDLAERNYTGKHIPSQPVSSSRSFSPRFRGVGGVPISPRGDRYYGEVSEEDESGLR